MFEKTPFTSTPYEYVSIITISANPLQVSSKRPVRITFILKVTALIIAFPGPIPYSSDKVVPWSYGADVYYHGVKQDLLVFKDKDSEDINPDISNIIGTNKITRSGRIFSPEISPKTIATPVIIPATAPVNIPITTPVIVPIAVPVNIPMATPIVSPTVIPIIGSAETRGKEVLVEPVQMKAHLEAIL